MVSSPYLMRVARVLGEAALLVAAFALLVLLTTQFGCSAKQRDALPSPESIVSTADAALRAVDAVHDNYGALLNLAVDDQAKAAAICAKVEPIISKVHVAAAALKELAVIYAASPTVESLDDLAAKRAEVLNLALQAAAALLHAKQELGL